MSTLTKLKFSTAIHAPKEKIWQILWNDATYRIWTGAFSEGSYAVSDWKEGSGIHFLSPSGDGLFSVIIKIIPNEFMSFEHHGILKDFKEQPLDEETRKWSGSMENYSLKEKNGITTLEVEVDVVEGFETTLKEAFPNALDRVRELAELKS